MLWLYFRSSAPHSITSHLNISWLEPTRVNSAREGGASHGLEMSTGTEASSRTSANSMGSAAGPALTPWKLRGKHRQPFTLSISYRENSHPGKDHGHPTVCSELPVLCFLYPAPHDGVHTDGPPELYALHCPYPCGHW